MRPNAIRKLTQLIGRSDVISLAAGAPSAETFPIEELAEITSRVLRERGHIALQYGPTRGLKELLEPVAATLHERGIKDAATSDILVTTGSQQGLDLVARVLLDPGDVVMVELPSYIGGIIALHNTQAELVGVRQDDGGIDLDDLREKIGKARRRGRRVKCIYTIPNFQNPSGVTLAAERRQALVDIAAEHDLLIIEDDPYYELYFTGRGAGLEPLAAIDRSRVIYLSSFSKVLAPGLRVAYLHAPPLLAAKIELAKEGADLSSSMFDQAVVAEAIREGLIERRLPAIREFYRVRCDAMLEAFDSYAPTGSRWTRPAGGFFVLMELPQILDATEMLNEVIEGGVAYVPGQSFFVDGGGTNTLRVAYSKETPERISLAIERMCRVFSNRLDRKA